MRLLTTLAAAAALSGSLLAQFQFATIPQPWTANNSGGVGGGVYFDLTVTAAVVITQFDCNLNDVAGTAGTIDVYTINGTYAGNENNQALWTLAGSAPCTAAGRDAPSAAVFNAPIVLNPGTYGIAICASGLSHAYTNGTGTNQTFSDPFFTANLGTALNVCFGTGAPFTPRVWNGVIHYNPAAGQYPAFRADVTSGPSPLTVNFTDLSYTSDPAGIIAWLWDIDNDGNVDYQTQNCTHTYTQCGNYDVSLQVVDAQFGISAPLVKTAYVTVDPITGSFTFSSLGNNTVQFTDTTVGSTTWAWDFDNDGTVDSNQQSPQHTYPAGGFYTCSLTVGNGCASDTVTQQVPTFGLLCTFNTGGTGLSAATSGNLFDLNVTNPNGVLVTALDVMSWTAATGTVDVWTIPNTYVGSEQNQAAWTQVASVGGVALGGNGVLVNVDVPDFYLAPGSHGLYVLTSAGVGYTVGNGTNQVFANGDMTLTAGASSTNFGAPITPRVWNGCIYYDTNPQGVYYFHKAGCAGSAGVTTNVAATGSAPRINTTFSVDLSPLPASNTAIMVFGIDDTVWNGLPLPLNGGPFGAPGCFLNITPESSSLVIGAGGTGAWNLPIPNNMNFVGTRFFTQALVIDPGQNGLGGVASDSATGVVGQ